MEQTRGASAEGTNWNAIQNSVSLCCSLGTIASSPLLTPVMADQSCNGREREWEWCLELTRFRWNVNKSKESIGWLWECKWVRLRAKSRHSMESKLGNINTTTTPLPQINCHRQSGKLTTESNVVDKDRQGHLANKFIGANQRFSQWYPFVSRQS